MNNYSNKSLKEKFSESESLTIDFEGRQITATIKEISPLSNSRADHITFSVLLSVKSDFIWEQGMFDLDLSGEKLSVFMVPVNQIDQDVHYEIIFN